jgi:hypothetical protein
VHGDGSDPDVEWHDALDQRIAQPLTIAFVMIVRELLGHGLPKVLLAERNEAIEIFIFVRPNEALSMRIRIRRRRSYRDFYPAFYPAPISSRLDID